jgi:ribosomal-protein-alanine N-acetyltransferase
MSEEPLIRPMRSDDVERVLEIAAGAENTPRWPRSAYLSALDPQAQPRRVALVLVDEASSTPVGFAIASMVASGVELETIAVLKDRQRQGLGKALVDRMVTALRLEGALEVWLEVRVSNRAALQLYRRAGFVEIGIRKGYYAEPIEDATVMRLTIE